MLRKLLALVSLVAMLQAQAPGPPGGLTVQMTGPTQTFDGPAELPRVYISSSLANTPTPGAVVQLAAGGDLQAALNSLQCGQVLELAAGATWAGKYTLPAKGCDDQHWMQVRTSTPDAQLPPEGQRIYPCYFGVASLAGRPAFTNCPSGGAAKLGATIIYTATGGVGPIVFAANADHYRIGPGIEITRSVGTGYIALLVQAGGGANHIGYDRVWVHGAPQDETDTGIGLNGESWVFAVDGYYTDFHCTSVIGSCSDAHVFGGGTSATQDGPYKFHNNFLEGAAQGILFGGGPATLTPADIEVTQNHFMKPMTWLVGQPGFVGGVDTAGKCPSTPGQCAFIVKNNLECKNCMRMLVEGNMFDYVWGGYTQDGYQVLLTPKSQAGPNGTNQCPLCIVSDVTIRYNRMSHSGMGISLANIPSDNGGDAQFGGRYSIHDIIIDDVDSVLYKGNGGAVYQILNAFPVPGTLNNIAINHTTVVPDPSTGKIISIGGSAVAGQTMYGFWFTNNIVTFPKYPVWSTGGTTNCAAADLPLPTMNSCWKDQTTGAQSYTFSNNAIVGVTGNYPASVWPPNQFFPPTAAAIQFTNWNNGNFGNQTGANYTLLSTSPYKFMGLDGKDLGADIAAITAATAGVY